MADKPLFRDPVFDGAADPVVVWDELGAGMQDKIAMIEGPEGAQAFRPEIKPVDAYNSAILDHIDIDDQPVG